MDCQGRVRRVWPFHCAQEMLLNGANIYGLPMINTFSYISFFWRRFSKGKWGLFGFRSNHSFLLSYHWSSLHTWYSMPSRWCHFSNYHLFACPTYVLIKWTLSHIQSKLSTCQQQFLSIPILINNMRFVHLSTATRIFVSCYINLI